MCNYLEFQELFGNHVPLTEEKITRRDKLIEPGRFNNIDNLTLLNLETNPTLITKDIFIFFNFVVMRFLSSKDTKNPCFIRSRVSSLE